MTDDDGCVGSAELRRMLNLSLRRLHHLYEVLPELEGHSRRLPDSRTRAGFRRRYPPDFVARLDVAVRLADAARLADPKGGISQLPVIARTVFAHPTTPVEGQLAAFQYPPRVTYVDDPADLVDLLDPDGGAVVVLHDLHGAFDETPTRPEAAPTRVPFVDYLEE